MRSSRTLSISSSPSIPSLKHNSQSVAILLPVSLSLSYFNPCLLRRRNKYVGMRKSASRMLYKCHLANTYQKPIMISAAASKNPHVGIINWMIMPIPRKKQIKPYSLRLLNMFIPPRPYIFYCMSFGGMLIQVPLT